MRVLVTGWPSDRHGEATAGDVLSMRSVTRALRRAEVPCDTAWSPGFLPSELHLEDADPEHYSHVVFVCGPAHGDQVRALHRRFASCVRIAVGVSVIDEGDPAVTGFHRVLARDSPAEKDPGSEPSEQTEQASRARPDLAMAAPLTGVPVAAVVLAPEQPEYGSRRRHDQVHADLVDWLRGQDCARVALDTRLDPADWRHCSTADQFVSAVARFDVVVTTRLHGLVLGLRAAVPVLTVDPVAGGGKVTAQARALRWPALIPADDVTAGTLECWWRWCLSAEAHQWFDRLCPTTPQLLGELLDAMHA